VAVQHGIQSLEPSCSRCQTATVLVAIPCHNEANTIATVVEDFKRNVGTAEILVADNGSVDMTGDKALAAGADVIHVPNLGKGRAVRRLLEHSDHDVTIIVDGDATYDPSMARLLTHLVFCRGYDLVNVARVPAGTGGEYRRGHRMGNLALTGLQRSLTGIQLTDILSGYKALSRRYVASTPLRSKQFQVEVEFAAHAIALDMAYLEVPGTYLDRSIESESKLSTYSDGFAILRAILRLYRDLRPFQAFALLALPWLIASVVLVGVPVDEYLRSGLVEKFPSLIAGVAAFITGMLLMSTGWILDRTQALRRDELALAGTSALRANKQRRLADVQQTF
jgi:glycosyltransferase involved in cell wall biosynthesis